MRRAPAVTAPETRHRSSSKMAGNSAFALPVNGLGTGHRHEQERGMNEQVIDMPPRCSDTPGSHADMSLHPGESGSALGRSDIHVPSFGEADGANGSNLHHASPVAEDQAVCSSIHTPPAGADGQLQYAACRRGEPGLRARDRELPRRGMQDARLSGRGRYGHLRGNRTCRTRRR